MKDSTDKRLHVSRVKYQHRVSVSLLSIRSHAYSFGLIFPGEYPLGNWWNRIPDSRPSFVSPSILTDQHVRGGQRSDEVVARLPDGPVHDERHQHKNVTGNGEDHTHADDQHDEHLLPGLERWQDRHQIGRRQLRGPVGRTVGTVGRLRRLLHLRTGNGRGKTPG